MHVLGIGLGIDPNGIAPGGAAMTGNLRPLVIEAVARFGSTQPLFSTVLFADVVWEEFDLRKYPHRLVD